MVWINLATTAKRLHDRNRSGWWAVAVVVVNRLSYLYYGLFFGLYFGVDILGVQELLLVMGAVALSVLQTWIVIELFFVIGTDGPNRFGPDPTRPVASRRSVRSRAARHSGFSPAPCRASRPQPLNPRGLGVLPMDYVWYLFRFDGRINRARCWLALLIIICWMIFLSLVLFGVAYLFGATMPEQFNIGPNGIFALIDPAAWRSLPSANLPTCSSRPSKHRCSCGSIWRPRSSGCMIATRAAGGSSRSSRCPVFTANLAIGLATGLAYGARCCSA